MKYLFEKAYKWIVIVVISVLISHPSEGLEPVKELPGVSTEIDVENPKLEKENKTCSINSNAYFYAEEETAHTYEGYFYLHSYTDLWQDIDLYIKKLQSFHDGALYALELEQPTSSDPYDNLLDRKYIGYFYVTAENIYYLPVNAEGYTQENNNSIINQIKSDEAKFLERCTVVCCENGTEDIIDENGYHAFVEVEGEKRIFRYYNDYFYGSKDYILMVWEKGKGLIYYIHGNGSKNMHVEFGNNIKEEQGVDYGYPYKLIEGEELLLTE